MLALASFTPGGKIAFKEFVDAVSFIHPFIGGAAILITNVYLVMQGAEIREVLRPPYRSVLTFFGRSFGIAAGAALAFILVAKLIPTYIPPGLRTILFFAYAVACFYTHIIEHVDEVETKASLR